MDVSCTAIALNHPLTEKDDKRGITKFRLPQSKFYRCASHSRSLFPLPVEGFNFIITFHNNKNNNNNSKNNFRNAKMKLS